MNRATVTCFRQISNFDARMLIDTLTDNQIICFTNNGLLNSLVNFIFSCHLEQVSQLKFVCVGSLWFELYACFWSFYHE